MDPKKERLVWIDLEMTGLDPAKDQILEIASIVTDGDLEIVAEGPNLAIHQPDEVLALMDDWCQKQHTKSGLVERVRTSEVSLSEAEQQTLNFIKAHVKPKVTPMCGNTIYQDRRFLLQRMPTLEDYFHYRNLDVSTVKELAKIWAPAVYQGVDKKGMHLALEDIKESINELRYYRTHFFKLDQDQKG